MNEVPQRGTVETTELSGGGTILSSRIPFRRNQDVIRIRQGRGKDGEVIAVVDGWNDITQVPSDRPGQEAASFVADRYPELFLALREQPPARAAQQAAEQLDCEFLRRYPPHVASVGAFAFCYPKRTVLVSVGTIQVWTWDGTEWRKPREIRDCFLPQPAYASGSRTFWGRSELKDDPFYGLRADSVTLPRQTPFFIATDGIDDVLGLPEINRAQQETESSFPGFFSAIVARVVGSDKQRDDIALLLCQRR